MFDRPTDSPARGRCFLLPVRAAPGNHFCRRLAGAILGASGNQPATSEFRETAPVDPKHISAALMGLMTVKISCAVSSVVRIAVALLLLGVLLGLVIAVQFASVPGS